MNGLGSPQGVGGGLFQGLRRNLAVYIVLVTAGAIAAAIAGSLAWPGDWSSGDIGRTLLLLGLTAAAASFPLKLSPQTTASLLSAPLFAAVIALAPAQAVIVGAGVIAPDIRFRRRPAILLFNLAMATLAVSLASSVFHALDGVSGGQPLLEGSEAWRAVVAGTMLFAANALTMGVLVSLRKGLSFWSQWKLPWLIDGIQEAGVLALGFIGAVLIIDAWWSVLLLVTPMVLAHLALDRSVREAAQNARLVKQVQDQLTELKATQAHLIQQEKMASIGTLAAGVAHEINNPLFAINAAGQLLLRQRSRHLASEKGVQYVQSILAMAEAASKITGDLLRYSRNKAAAEPIKMQAVLDASVVLVGADLTLRGISIKKEYRETPPVLAVMSQVQQVVVKLLMNARDATPKDGTVTLRCWAEDGHVFASVRDTGTGIPPEALPHVFEPFYTTKPVGKGTGLGLYICHKIVTEHRGQIRVSSKANEGTEVTLEFPAYAPETAARSVAEAVPAA